MHHDDSIVRIPLTKGMFAIVDADDAEWLSASRWHAMTCRGTTYAARKSPMVQGKRGRTILMHREITKAGSGDIVDHKDRDGLNNRRSNLRLATPSLNNANSKMRSHNTSGFRGVVRTRNGRRWVAEIRFQGRRKYLGTFDTAEEAAVRYNKEAALIFGEYATLN